MAGTVAKRRPFLLGDGYCSYALQLTVAMWTYWLNGSGEVGNPFYVKFPEFYLFPH